VHPRAVPSAERERRDDNTTRAAFSALYDTARVAPAKTRGNEMFVHTHINTHALQLPTDRQRGCDFCFIAQALIKSFSWLS